MMRITMPVEAGNAAIKNGRLPQLLGDAIGRLKPEATYFVAENGIRTAYMVIDIKDPSEIPPIAEPFFLELNAKVDFMLAMNGDDLKKGLAQLGGA